MCEQLILALVFSFVGFLIGLLPKFFDRRVEKLRGNFGLPETNNCPPMPPVVQPIPDGHSVRTQGPKRPLPPAPRRNYDVPILSNRDQTKPIGFAQPCSRGILVTLDQPMSRKQVFEIFGNCDCIVESYRNALIEKFILTHWSHDAPTTTA